MRITCLQILCNVHKNNRQNYKTKCNMVSDFENNCVIFTIDAFGLNLYLKNISLLPSWAGMNH